MFIIVDENITKYWVFSFAKSIVINFVYGGLNYIIDAGDSFLSSKWSDFWPDENTTVSQLILSFTFLFIILRFVLRLLIFLAPIGNYFELFIIKIFVRILSSFRGFCRAGLLRIKTRVYGW